MSEADFKKSRNRKFRKARQALEQAMLESDKVNGPGDWAGVTHFLSVGEYELAVEQFEWAVMDQDLRSSKAADDQLNDAKRMLGLFQASTKAPYDKPKSELPDWRCYRSVGDAT